MKGQPKSLNGIPSYPISRSRGHIKILDRFAKIFAPAPRPRPQRPGGADRAAGINAGKEKLQFECCNVHFLMIDAVMLVTFGDILSANINIPPLGQLLVIY